jgi:hypothetical protein
VAKFLSKTPVNCLQIFNAFSRISEFLQKILHTISQKQKNG